MNLLWRDANLPHVGFVLDARPRAKKDVTELVDAVRAVVEDLTTRQPRVLVADLNGYQRDRHHRVVSACMMSLLTVDGSLLAGADGVMDELHMLATSLDGEGLDRHVTVPA